MEEMYTLHELQGDEIFTENAEPHMCEPLMDAEPGPSIEREHEPVTAAIHSQVLEFVSIEEPGPDWEMELAQAYVRAQPLEGVFLPEEGLRMGTAFPNLSQPYGGRE